MLFARYINESTVEKCPRNGYIGKKAVSNLKRFFNIYPEVAKQEGYTEFIPSNDEGLGVYRYSVENGKIIERVVSDDN